MDPITIAIVAAISAGALSMNSKVEDIASAYVQLKELLVKKFGAKSKIIKAVNELESKPKSAARTAVVKEEIGAAKADQDFDLLQAAQALLKSIKALHGGTQIIQTAIGDQNIQIA